MKIGICGDIHVCKQSSIITGNGKKFTQRLDNCIESINWFEEITAKNGCDQLIYLGDFFNTPDLDEKTITAIRDIKWNSIPKVVLVGNHDSSEFDLKFNASKAIESDNIKIINAPSANIVGDTTLVYLPYIVETDKKPLTDYIKTKTSKTIVFSHNDIKGIQMGPVMSTLGFELEDINKNVNLFINGHLHNGMKISDHLINLGILTGQNFGEDASKYNHNIMILDTDTLQYELIENPFAFNFYKLDIKTTDDLKLLDTLKNQAVLLIKCDEKLIEALKAKLVLVKEKLAETRIITVREVIADGKAEDITELVMDHLAKFCECCKEKIDNTAILETELAEICK